MTPRQASRRNRRVITVDDVRTVSELAVRPHRGLENIYRRFGPVYTMGAGPSRYVFLLGPAATRFVLDRSDLFAWGEAYDVLRVVDGDTALIVSDGADHARRRRLMAPAFSRRQVEIYANTVRATMDAALGAWRPGQVLDLYRELRKVIRRSAIEVLFGPRLAAEEAELGRLLQDALDVVDRPPPAQQLQRLGLPSWRRARRSRAEVARRVRHELVRRRRRMQPDDSDLLTALLDSGDAGDGGLTDEEITDQVISLMAAGYETTSAAMGWATATLVADPPVCRRARDSVTGTDGSWRYLDGVVSETLRLYPPAVLVARKAVTPFEFEGHRVRAGSTVLISPYVTHRLSQLWDQPLRFDPTRWDPRRSDPTHLGPASSSLGASHHHKPAPHEFLPFGGGPHRCLGATFATTEMTVILEQLLRRVRLLHVRTDPRPVGLTAMRPRRGPIVRVVDVDSADDRSSRNHNTLES